MESNAWLMYMLKFKPFISTYHTFAAKNVICISWNPSFCFTIFMPVYAFSLWENILAYPVTTSRNKNSQHVAWQDFLVKSSSNPSN